jgi:hypothetical protein
LSAKLAELRQRQAQIPWAAATNSEFIYELANFNLDVAEDEEPPLNLQKAMLINFYIIYYFLNFPFLIVNIWNGTKPTMDIMDPQ